MALYFIENDARKGLKISFLLTSPLRLEKENAFYFKQETSILGKAWNFFSQLYLFLCVQDFLIFPPFFFPLVGILFLQHLPVGVISFQCVHTYL